MYAGSYVKLVCRLDVIGNVLYFSESSEVFVKRRSREQGTFVEFNNSKKFQLEWHFT